MTSFNLVTSFKTVCKYSHILRFGEGWWLEPPHSNLVDMIQPITAGQSSDRCWHGVGSLAYKNPSLCLPIPNTSCHHMPWLLCSQSSYLVDLPRVCGEGFCSWRIQQCVYWLV